MNLLYGTFIIKNTNLNEISRLVYIKRLIYNKNMDINLIKKEALDEISQTTNDLKDLERWFKKYLGKKGKITLFLRTLKDMPNDKKILVGKEANEVKKILNKILEKRKTQLNKSIQVKTSSKEWIDVTAPGILSPQGSHHPISLVRQEIEEIFQSMGFSVTDGPEIETEYYNFDALNVPKDHPARDVWDTFWIKEKNNISDYKKLKNKLLLRTHTSPVQIRHMKTHNPPLRIIAPGRCFRHEATDASHDVQFHQIEGLMIDKNISLANLKGVLEHFMKRFYGKNIVTRWQPSYFPFVEPGLELLMKCDICKGEKCSTCGDGWIEVIPCGMIHPNVFKSVGYNPKNWQGFAFGMGLDRLVMMKYRINDIRLLYSGDLRFLKQF